MRIAENLVELIGSTPLVRLSRFAGEGARVLAKLESRNPAGSAKDRIAAEMIAQAEAEGRLKPGATIIPDASMTLAPSARRPSPSPVIFPSSQRTSSLSSLPSRATRPFCISRLFIVSLRAFARPPYRSLLIRTAASPRSR